MSYHPDDYQPVPTSADEREIKDRYDYWNARTCSREAGALLVVAEMLLRQVRALERQATALEALEELLRYHLGRF